MSITSQHLLLALDDAERAAAEPIDTPAGPRQYKQANWDCGTACCIHGFAALRATGEPARDGPTDDDYADLPTDLRDGVVSVLMSRGGTPDMVRRVLDGRLAIGRNTTIGADTIIGDGTTIGDGAIINA